MDKAQQYYPYQSNSYYQSLTEPNGLARNLCFPPNCPVQNFPMDYRKADINLFLDNQKTGFTRFIENVRPVLLYPFYPPVYSSF